MSYEKMSGVYDALMTDFDYDSWAKYLYDILAEHGIGQGAAILECGCGTGELSLRLKRFGYNIVASDISQDMLSVAQEKMRKSGLNMPFVLMDMRNVVSHRPVKAILACCDAVNYLTSIKAVEDFFASCYTALSEGGLLLFDISTRYKLSTVLGNNTFTYDEEDTAYIWLNTYDADTKLLGMDLTFFQKLPSGDFTRFHENHVQRAHSVKELTHRALDAGFSVVGEYDAFTRLDPSQDAQRIQLVFKKH